MRITVSNRRGSRRRVGVEPWGDFVDVEPGQSVQISMDSAAESVVNIDDSSEALLLWAETDDVNLRIERSD